MAFWNQLTITLIDKGLLALLFALVGYFVNRRLHDRKARDELLRAAAPERVAAYKQLWSLTVSVKASDVGDIDVADRATLASRLTDWYYSNAGGMFLSHQAASAFLVARDLLKEGPAKDIREEFSTLRSQLKYDLRFYSAEERTRQL
jgi:hypothetical protein